MTADERRAKQAAASKAKYHSLTLEERRARNTSPAAKAARQRTRAKPTTQAKDKAYCAKWWAENKEWKGFVRRLSTYGLTLDQYHAMAEQQNFLCAICKEEPVAKQSHASNDNFAIDHNHTSHVVRGLLCNNCNIGIGHLKDQSAVVMQAADYLVKHELKEAA